MVCLEYLEEAFPASQNQIMPRSAEGRAQARYWCIFINEKIIPQYYKMLMRPSLEEQDAAKRDLIGIAFIYLCEKNIYNMMLTCYFVNRWATSVCKGDGSQRIFLLRRHHVHS